MDLIIRNAFLGKTSGKRSLATVARTLEPSIRNQQLKIKQKYSSQNVVTAIQTSNSIVWFFYPICSLHQLFVMLTKMMPVYLSQSDTGLESSDVLLLKEAKAVGDYLFH